MNSNIKRNRTATGLLTMALGMTPLGLGAATGATLGEQNVRTLLNAAVSYHYQTKVRGKTAEGACYFDPQKPTTTRCSWRWAGSGADPFRLRQKVKRDTVKWCKESGGESCIELFRNGKLTYDGLPPEETRRLASVLESLPSYDREAAPLPEGTTIRAGLYHERFAQMRGHWEDWRNKKAKGKRHYALCANEQGAGVRFVMQGGFKELPRVREMCILQCQAVAQWEEKPGRCHTLFENGSFTSAAAERAMQLDVVPASPAIRDAFIGAWKAIGHRGISIEAVIERVDADGGVAGTGCSEYPNGALAWRTLDEATFLNGDRITIMNGNVRVTMMRNGARSGTPELVQTWPSGWQRSAPVQSMSTIGCNGRFTMEAAADSAVERQADDAPVRGAWSGRWKNGTIAEIEIEAVDPNRAFTGRYCTKRTSGVLRLWDVGPGRRFEGTVAKGGKKARFTIPTGNGTRAELEFKMKGDSKLTMKHKARAGTNREKASTVKMARGAAEDGCLRRTTRS